MRQCVRLLFTGPDKHSLWPDDYLAGTLVGLLGKTVKYSPPAHRPICQSALILYHEFPGHRPHALVCLEQLESSVCPSGCCLNKQAFNFAFFPCSCVGLGRSGFVFSAGEECCFGCFLNCQLPPHRTCLHRRPIGLTIVRLECLAVFAVPY